jgi:hypothetical protein
MSVREQSLIETRDRLIENALQAETVRVVDGKEYILHTDANFNYVEVCREDHIRRLRERAEVLLG